MGFDADFEREEFESKAPFECFPVGEVVAVKSASDLALPLSRYFKSHPIEAVSLDVGLFDRMVRGQPEYAFVRGQAPA
jgi:hypothetical protein